VVVKNLLGASDIADRLGFDHGTSVNNLRRRHASFPEPVAIINGTHQVWDWSEVEAWAKANGRMTADGVAVRAPRSKPRDTNGD
jgi:hypothetical protein